MMMMRVLAATGALAALALPAGASHGGVHVITPYPAVSVEAGQSSTFRLEVTASGKQRVDLKVTRKPKGWGTTLRGGGFVVSGVYTDPKTPPDVTLEVQVPADARQGSYAVNVRGSGGGSSDTLEFTLRVAGGAEEGGGAVEMTTEFPSLQAGADATFTYEVTLSNNTPEEGSFALTAVGPEGWLVDARPSGQEQAATLTVAGGSTGALTVTADPPDEVTAGPYTVQLTATGAGQEAILELTAEITGSFDISLTTPDERLNVDVSAGEPTAVPLVVVNNGSAPVAGVAMTATPPTGWKVTFSPRTVEEIQPGKRAEVSALITPASEAVAGDYLVTMQAAIPEKTSSVEMRTTVKTSGVWGFIGLLLIAAAIGGLAWVFRTYGRR